MGCTTEEVKMLAAEFPKEDIHWRAQSLTKDGDKAMALAYLDARDVMDRLDQIVGPENWQDRYESDGPKTICYLSVRIGEEWVTKADGAGDTQVEAEKGSISGAFKRAAVKWGIGRYLYDMPAPWVPCESYERQGRRHWKRWTADPWSYVSSSMKAKPATSAAAMKRGLAEIDNDLADCDTLVAVNACAKEWQAKVKAEDWSADYKAEAAKKFAAARERIKKAEAENTFPGDLNDNPAVQNMMAG